MNAPFPLLSRRRPTPAALPRRRLLQAAAVTSLMALAGCGRGPPRQSISGSFLQLWESHLALDRDQWRRRLRQQRQLGCTELVLQWTGLYGGAETPWQAGDEFLQALFDDAWQLGMGIVVGMPHDQRWWQTLWKPDAELAAFLDDTREAGLRYLRTAAWPAHAGFRGWYIPYEIDQYSWATPARQAMLLPWLDAFCQEARQTADRPAAISTFFSPLGGPGRLDQLWRNVLDHMAPRLMVQDGVGVAGLKNLDGIAPLCQFLKRRVTAYDLIIEVFQELPSERDDGTTFAGRTARPGQVEAQLAWARESGAERLLAFALDPWVIADTADARQLRRTWPTLQR